jgi:hypothetical protein
MKNLKINIFIAHTEYHFIQSLNIAMSYFKDGQYENQIHITKKDNRFENVIDPKLNNNIKITFHIERNQSEIVQQILKLKNCHRLFFFQENSIYNRYIAYSLKKKHNTIVCLGPDGYKPYAIYNKKHETLSMIKDTFLDNFELYRNNLITNKIFKSENYRYGSTGFIDEVWLSEISSFDVVHNKTKSKIKQIKPFTVKSITAIKLYFEKIPILLKAKTKIILYFNQVYWTDELINKEMEFLNNLNLHFNKIIYLKPHPATPIETIIKYKKIPNIEIVVSKLPAELFILDIKDSIIFSGWSTALITYNSTCNYYFNLPIYKNCGGKAIDQSKLTVLSHIKLINKPSEMEFPNE